MRIARHGQPGQQRPLISGSDGRWRDLIDGLGRQRQTMAEA